MGLSLSLTKIPSLKKVLSYFTFPVEKETMSDEKTIEFSWVSVYNKPSNFAITPLPSAFEWLQTRFRITSDLIEGNQEKKLPFARSSSHPN